VARASDFGVEINGTYRVTTDGGWAQVNDVYKDEPTIVETWTMSSSCVSPVECEGTAVSSGGWTARLWYGFPNFYWVVDRNIPQWQFCPDGTTAPGEQRFQFAGFDPIATERIMTITNFMIGRQRTISPSGSCGRNQPLVIETPLTADHEVRDCHEAEDFRGTALHISWVGRCDSSGPCNGPCNSERPPRCFTTARLLENLGALVDVDDVVDRLVLG
jgi:hypothetical protein